MKKTILTIFALVLVLPLVFCTNNQTEAKDITFAKRLSGRLLLDVENGGSIWYVDTKNYNKHNVTWSNAMQLFREFSLGITDEDLSKIPASVDGLPNTLDTDQDGYSDVVELQNGYNPYSKVTDKIVYDSNLANRLKGELLLQVNQGGAIWYVDIEGIRHSVTFENLMPLFESLALGISEADLGKFDEEIEADPYNLAQCEIYREEYRNVFNKYKDFLYKSEFIEDKDISFEEASDIEDIVVGYVVCYREKAIEYNDSSICENMINDIDIDYCKANYAIEKEDKSICEEVDNAMAYNQCYKIFLQEAQGRDAKRISDVKRIATEIELMRIEGKQILDACLHDDVSGIAEAKSCVSGDPEDFIDPSNSSLLCTPDSKESCQYSMTNGSATGLPTFDSYRIYFFLEAPSELGNGGLYYMNKEGEFIR